MADVADVVVVGMGPGGEDVAGRLAEAGLDVVGVEAELVGGECPYWGCVPSKMIVRAADLLAEARRIPGTAGSATVTPDWKPVAERIRNEATDHWDDRVAVDRFVGKGARFLRGRGRLDGPGRVTVMLRDGGTSELEARRAVVVATGAEPTIPPIRGLAGTPFWTNREAVAVEEPPSSLAVLGGGAVGLELAQAFARFGTEVTVLEMADQLLPASEPEAASLVQDVLEREGAQVHTGAQVEQVAFDEGDRRGFALDTADGSRVRAERLLVSTGRRARTSGIGLETVDVDPNRLPLATDEQLRVAHGVHVVGDATGGWAFTHVAMHHADVVVAAILGETGPPLEVPIPRVTFTDPEVGAVGFIEAQAREAGVDVRTACVPLPSSARGWIHGPGNDGLVKLVADAERGVLVGGTTAGPSGGEILGLLSLAVHARVPVSELRTMIYAYPTFHRAVQDAVRELAA